MNLPLRVMLALLLIGAFGGIAIWRIVVVLQTRWLTNTMRLFDISVVILFIALLIAWVVFYWPAYWDWVALTSPSASAGGIGLAMLSR